jgi:epoxyqueuosine reductase
MQEETQMDLEDQLRDSAMDWGADYFGIADLTPARDAILEQGGTEITQYPRSISVGIALFHTIVNQLFRRPDRAVAVSYRSHGETKTCKCQKGQAAWHRGVS